MHLKTNALCGIILKNLSLLKPTLGEPIIYRNVFHISSAHIPPPFWHLKVDIVFKIVHAIFEDPIYLRERMFPFVLLVFSGSLRENMFYVCARLNLRVSGRICVLGPHCVTSNLSVAGLDVVLEL